MGHVCGRTASTSVPPPPPPADTGAWAADTLYGLCTTAAVTAVGAPQLSMELNQMIAQTQAAWVQSPYSKVLQSQETTRTARTRGCGSVYAAYNNAGVQMVAQVGNQLGVTCVVRPVCTRDGAAAGAGGPHTHC